ncbi:hypothetical protein BU251_09145 [Candidatus Velamenicoccus archaeovorus]|jgi:hypothetical protein|uniref:Uncharacterized protein n=1 Tax=Velamenicoccus archaeovorus TaxID=1930593 RepID=A0A410P6P7_VELA1|nr:hypothetical protein [Candidatus Velamenicoccus archaeovorus]MDD5500535.1 hypothetical protein [Candidatus Omnitrophota bacterium]QAT17876.1 hypothetical protein BU251_09145 [Candidatus Velamenicoccus archaeovorus]
MEEISKVRLEFDLHEYRRLALVIRDHKSLLYKLKMNELIKQGLIKDMNLVIGILERAEVKPKKEEVEK